MGCSECVVVDENILISGISTIGDENSFMICFMDKEMKFCLSKKLKKKYSKKLKRLGKMIRNRDIDVVLFKKIATALYRDAMFKMCHDDFCSEEYENDKRLNSIPREDRFLVLISEFFDADIVTEDRKLISAVNGSPLSCHCYSSKEEMTRLGCS